MTIPKDRIEKIDITPDRSILHKIGEANYSISAAIAELVDNSIDAANDEGVEISVVLDKQNGRIVISDNGVGMNKDTAAGALVLAHSTKKNALGEFGLGLKSACTSLGNRFILTTTPAGSIEKYTLIYDKEMFMQKGDWKSFPLEVSSANKGDHGTMIVISDLRVKLYDALVTRLKADLALRYGPYITHNGVVIKVGLKEESAKPCKPVPVELDAEGRRDFTYRLRNGREVSGWWGLRKTASGVESGFDMFRRGRLIRASEKLGYNPHPMANHITGEIFLDPVPVTHNKREFITESAEFKEFIEEFWGDKTGKLVENRVKGLIDEITRIASERWNQEKADKQMPEPQKETLKDSVLRALNRVDDFRELAFPDLTQQKKRDENGQESPMETRDVDTRVAREEPIDEVEEPQGKRTPSKTQQKKAKYVMINGKKFKFDFFLQNLDDETLDKQTVTTESGIEVYINTGFKGYLLTKDTDFYCTFHIAEAIAEIYLKESDQGIARIFELRNKLLFEVASVVLEEEELKKLSETEAELEQIKMAKSALEEKSKRTRL